MTGQIETAIAEQNSSRWQKLVAWLTTFGEAMDYDPLANTDATIRHLREEVGRLETRVSELEARNRRAQDVGLRSSKQVELG